MNAIIDFVKNHPELIAIVLAGVDSFLMPFVPVKWNGVALFILNVFRKKLVPTPVEKKIKSNTDEIVDKMQIAVDEMNKKAAEAKLGE